MSLVPSPPISLAGADLGLGHDADAECGLGARLVEAREAAARVGWFKVGRDGRVAAAVCVQIGGAIETVHVLPQRRAIGNVQDGTLARGQLFRKSQRDRLGLVVLIGAHHLQHAIAQRDAGVVHQVQMLRAARVRKKTHDSRTRWPTADLLMQNDGLGGLLDLQRNGDFPVEDTRGQVGGAGAV